MTRVLLDTDINLDFVLARQPFFVEAREIFRGLAQNKFEACIAGVTAVNIYYFGRKEKGRDAALKELEKLLRLVKVCSISSIILQKAVNSPITDYEDAVQHECAVAENLDAIVTRNTKDYKNASIKVYTPSEFLQFLQTV
ncbi:MAG: PIN domain-containing protein [Pyrinomonadaceae bacterium]